jgi:hypothetical protein
MSSEEKFYIACCSILAITIISISTAITVHNQMDNNAILEMVRAGKDPMEARCAVAVNQLTVVACSQYAIKESK